MGLTRDIFVDPKLGANWVVGERLTSEQLNAVVNGLRALESAANRSAIQNFRLGDGNIATGVVPNALVWCPATNLWAGAGNGTAGTVYRITGAGTGDWLATAGSLSMPSGFFSRAGAVNSDSTIVFAGGSSSTSSNERIIRSTDGGVTFSKGTIGTASTQSVLVMVHDPVADLFVAGFDGNGGAIYTSPDGVTWTAKSPPGALSAVEFVDAASNEESGTSNKLILTAESGNYAYASASDNYTAWTASSFPASGSYRIAYCKGQRKWIAATASNGYVSDDGLSWTAFTMPTVTNGLVNVGAIGDLMILLIDTDDVFDANIFRISSDAGATWQYAAYLPGSVSHSTGYSDRQIIWVNGDDDTAWFTDQS